jgi:hypothetical protein
VEDPLQIKDSIFSVKTYGPPACKRIYFKAHQETFPERKASAGVSGRVSGLQVMCGV